MNHPTFPIRCASAMLLAAALLFAAAPHGAETLREAAPDFTLKSSSGENLKLSEYRGQVVLINFWASWCGPCRQEMPALDRLHSKYQPLGFTVLGVNVDENPSQAQALLDKVPVDFPVLYDSRNTVSKSYDVKVMPTTVVVDRNGDARYLHHGYSPGDEDEYQRRVRALLMEQP